MKTQVLLAAYNGSLHLPELLSSLCAQTDRDFSVLMQDDGSSDKTPEILKDISGKDARFSFASEQNRHLGAAENFLSLIRQSDADAVMLCDQDDVWEEEKISVLKQALADAQSRFGESTPILVHSDCSLVSEDGEPIGDSFFRHQGWNPGAVTLPPLLVQNNVTGCTLIMNRALRDLVAQQGRVGELFMHDWFIALTAASFGRIVFVDRPLTRYRQHGDNAIGASRDPLPVRAFRALGKKQEAKRRILLTYTHTKIFSRIWGEKLPAEARKTVDAYLATQRMPKLRRLKAIRSLGCVMQSRITRLGQLLFG